MKRDARGLEISTDDDAVVAAVDLFREQMLAIGTRIADVLRAADEHPESALLQALAATVGLYGQDRSGTELGAHYLTRAQAAGAPNEREALYLAATRAGVDGDIERAAELLEALTQRWPRDLLAAKVCEFHYYQMGQHWSGARFLAHMDRLAADNAESSHFLAMWAFANELAGARPRAIELARRAIAVQPETPWAHHALAHALLRDGRPAEGIASVEPFLASWSRFARAIESHNSWHLALFHWAMLDIAPAWALYRQHIWNGGSETTGERLDIISFFWRLELAGETVADAEWQGIADRVVPHTGVCAIPFNAAHYAYALCRAGRNDDAEQLRECTHAFAARQAGDRAKAWREAGVPLVDASIAMARGDAAAACAHLEPVAEIGRVGGSDAQDDLFRYAQLVALMDAGRRADARRLFDQLLEGREPTPVEAGWLARI